MDGGLLEKAKLLSTQEIKKMMESSLSEVDSEMSHKSSQVNCLNELF